MRQGRLTILRVCFYQFQYARLHRALFLSLHGNNSLFIAGRHTFLLLKFFHNLVDTTYVSYVLVMQQVLLARSSLLLSFYRRGAFSFFVSLHDADRSLSPPFLCLVRADPFEIARVSLLGEYLQHYFANTFYMVSTRSLIWRITRPIIIIGDVNRNCSPRAWRRSSSWRTKNEKKKQERMKGDVSLICFFERIRESEGTCSASLCYTHTRTHTYARTLICI